MYSCYGKSEFSVAITTVWFFKNLLIWYLINMLLLFVIITTENGCAA